MQITLKPLTDSGTAQIKEHGTDWIIRKWHPMVKAFEGPAYWVESTKTNQGMWVRCAIDADLSESAKLVASIEDPDFKHII